MDEGYEVYEYSRRGMLPELKEAGFIQHRLSETLHRLSVPNMCCGCKLVVVPCFVQPLVSRPCSEGLGPINTWPMMVPRRWSWRLGQVPRQREAFLPLFWPAMRKIILDGNEEGTVSA
eukprot:1295148-Amphidinium_carterae.1